MCYHIFFRIPQKLPTSVNLGHIEYSKSSTRELISSKTIKTAYLSEGKNLA